MIRVTASELCVLVALAVMSCTLQAPTSTPLPAPPTHTYTDTASEEGESVGNGEEEGVVDGEEGSVGNGEEGEEGSSCPGFQAGTARERVMDGCTSGTKLGAVDHQMAFGLDGPNWSSCALPSLPLAK